MPKERDNMEMPIAVMNILEAVKATTMFNKTELSKLLISNKIHISVTSGPVISVKLLPVSKPKLRVNINPRLSEKIKLAKQMLKNNTDAIYLFTLLARVKEYSDKLKLKDLTPEGLETVRAEFDTAYASLNKINKQLVKLEE